VPKLLKLLLGRLLVSSAAEEQEERQLRVPVAAVLTAAAPAAVVDDASCSSKVDNFDKKNSTNRWKISPRCRLSSRRIIANTIATKKASKCVAGCSGRYLHFELTTVLSKRRGSNQCGISVPGVRCFSDFWIRSGIRIRAGSGMNITGSYSRELSNNFLC
jgi:hypothetical protein